MDEKSIELARESLDAADKELRPGYQQIGKMLSKELVLNENQDLGTYEARNNARLILDFVGTLPQGQTEVKHGVRTSFKADSPQEARAIQSSVIWLRTWSGAFDWGGGGFAGLGYPTIDFAIRPYWVLGQSYMNRTDKQFVLAPASIAAHRGDVDRGNYVNFDSWSPVHRQLNKTQSGLIVFKPSRKDQDVLSTLDSKFFDIPLQEDERYPSAIDHKSPGADVISMYARVAMAKMQSVDGIPDYQLDANNIFEKLFRLAAMFEKRTELDSLLQSYVKSLEAGDIPQ